MKIQPLIEVLTTLFSEFGNVLDVIAKKNIRAKGQAFIVFDRPESANNAIDELQGFELFDKPMKLSIARTQSDKTVEISCSPQDYETHKRVRLAEKGRL